MKRPFTMIGKKETTHRTKCRLSQGLLIGEHYLRGCLKQKNYASEHTQSQVCKLRTERVKASVKLNQDA